MSDKRTVLIADDEFKIRALLGEILKNAGFNVIEAKDGGEALALFNNNKDAIDLAIIDLMMPVYDGYAVCKKIKEIKPELPAIMLTARSEELDERLAFEVGADDFVSKPIKPSALIARIERRLQMGKKITDEINVNGIVVNALTHKVLVDGEPIQLSPTEYNLLVYLMQNTSKVISREKLLYDVWGSDYVGTLRTVDVHMARLRVKLGSKSNMLLAERGFGYKFEVINN
ncbi:MAG: response regulator transcription factor [Spirochaetaceae bacterium]|nr:response regulator transcription factor [Spirochaetaceae bacterium]